MGFGKFSWTVVDHALQDLIERGIWVRGRLLNTLVTFGKIWVSWHSAASEHNMHQRLPSNGLNCILMSWWLWRLFLNQIGVLELHLVLIKLMHLPSSNVLREWKQDTQGVLFWLTLSQGLSPLLILWRVYKTLQSEGYHHISYKPRTLCGLYTGYRHWESEHLHSRWGYATGPLSILG